jgi:valyl-tRNA synthetase
MTALKTVYCQKANPNDETWNNLLKLIIDDNHFEIIGHHKYLNFVCKEILIDQALTISKLLVNALNPSDEDPIDTATKEATINFFELILKIIQPFTPFIAEEIWHLIRERKEKEDLVIASWPTVGQIDENILNQFNTAEETIIHIRNIRKQNNIATKVKMDLFVKKDSKYSSDFETVIIKMGNLNKLESTEDKITNAYSFLVQSSDFFIPFGDSIDFEAERKKIEEELEYTNGFLSIVSNKLNNEKFVSGAPEAVVANEKKKQADAQQKIIQLEEKLANLV